MTPEAYQTYVSWPEGRPDAYGGGGSSFGTLSDDRLMEDSDRDDKQKYLLLILHRNGAGDWRLDIATIFSF